MRATDSPRRPLLPADPGPLTLALACLAVEALLLGADLGLWGTPGWRRAAIEYGGFWAGLLGTWRPNYPGQPVPMFLTYAFLHSGPMHFAVNTATLLSLGPVLVRRIGEVRFLAVYALSAVGGALAFAFILPSAQPMVGASGALFGLLGAILAGDFMDNLGQPGNLADLGKAVLVVVGLNLVLWWAMHGLLAWQTHLGGFVAGSLLGIAFAPRNGVRREA